MICSKKSLIVSFAALALLATSACSVDSKRSKDYTPGQATDFGHESGTNFRVDSMKVNSATPLSAEKGGFSTHLLAQKKSYNFTACLQDAGGNAVQPDLPFVIQDDSGGTISAVTAIGGCLNWSETHAYNLPNDEGYYKMARTFRARGTYRGAVFAVFAFSPWSDMLIDIRKDATVAGQGMKDVGPLSVLGSGLLAQQATSGVRLNIDSLKLEYRGLDQDQFSIDRQLNLTVAQKYHIALKPTFTHKTILNPAKVDPFVGGSMKAYVAIFREQRDPVKQFDYSNMIFATEFTVNDPSSGGLFLADLTLGFDRLADLTSRTVAVLTIVPDEGMSEQSFFGTLKPGRLSDINLSPSQISARDFSDRLKRQKLEAKTPSQVFAIQSGYKPLDLQNVKISGWFQNYEINIADLVQQRIEDRLAPAGQNELNKALCMKLYSDSTMQTACVRNPNAWMSVARKDFAENILSQPIRMNRIPQVETLSFSVSTVVLDSSADSNGWSWNGGFGVNGGLGTGLGLPDLNFLGFGISGGIKANIGGSLFYLHEKKNSTASTDSTIDSSSTTVTLNSTGLAYSFDAEVRPCLIATAKGQTSAGISAGAFSCATTTRKEKRTETYYLITQTVAANDSILTDADSNEAAPWRMMIRGKPTKELVFGLVKNTKMSLELTQISEDQQKNDQGQLDAAAAMIQEYQGILTTP